MKRFTVFPLLLLLGLSACLESSTGPAGGAPPEILLRVTGGLAGVDYTVFVDGPQREVIGESCVSGCDFEEGEVLHGLTEEQIDYIADLFAEADVHGLDGSDFGNQCCDQFYYDLEYSDRKGTSTLRGSSEALPQDLRDAVGVVAGFASDLVPIILDPDGVLEDWQVGSAHVIRVEIQGDSLTAEVTHEMGCGPHHLDLAVFGGWMESDPVQIQAVFQMDDSGTYCDTPLITREVYFDLRPLKRAYREAYGVSTPGTNTVALMIHGAPAFSSLWWNRFEYTF